MKLKNIVILLVTVGSLVLIPGCKKSAVFSPEDAVGRLLNYEGCKTIQANRNSHGDLLTPGVQECFEYEFDGENTLLIKHSNAVFNCCPENIVANIEFIGHIIYIEEREINGICNCLCHYDLYYRLDNITPGVYTIRIKYAGRILEYSINLNSSRSGSRCWDSQLPVNLYFTE